MENSNNIKLVDCIDDIKESNVKYALKSNPKKFIEIEFDSDGYSVYGMISGDMPTYVTGSSWNTVKFWKSFNAVIKALKLYSKDGRWGMGQWNIN